MPNDSQEILGRFGSHISLNLNQEQFDSIERSNYPAYILSRTGDFVYANDAFAEYTDNSKAKILTLNTDRMRDTFEPSIRELVLRNQGEASVFQEIVTAHHRRRSQLAIGKPIVAKTGAKLIIPEKVGCMA